MRIISILIFRQLATSRSLGNWEIRLREDGTRITVAETEVTNGSSFSPVSLGLQTLCNTDRHRPIIFSCYGHKYSCFGNQITLIGSAQTSVNEMLTLDTFPIRQKGGSSQQCGLVRFKDVRYS